MKYVGGLHESIQKELKLFKFENISKASMKAMGIEKNNHPKKGKKGNKFKKDSGKTNRKGEPNKK